MNTLCRIFPWIEAPLKLGESYAQGQEEQLTLIRRHLPGEQAGSACTQLATGKEGPSVPEEPFAF